MNDALETRPRRALLLENDALQRDFWHWALTQQKFSLRSPRIVRDPQFALALLRAAGETPALIVASLGYVSALNRNPYQLTKTLGAVFPECAVVLVHAPGSEVTEAMRAVARRYGALDLVPATTSAEEVAALLEGIWFSACAQPRRTPSMATAAATMTMAQQVAVQLRASLVREAGPAKRAGTQGVFDAQAMLRSAAKFSTSEEEFLDWMNELVQDGSLLSVTGAPAFDANTGGWRFFVELPVSEASPDTRAQASAAGSASIDGIEPLAVMREMAGRGGLPALDVKDRSFRFKQYPACFVGSEAVDWLVAHKGLSRPLATRLGERMFERGLLRHVVDDQNFKDGFFFYRFVAAADQRSDTRVASLDSLKPDEVAAAMRDQGGVDIQDRRFRLKTYPMCFVGSAATDWLVARYRLSRPLAVKLGERLVAAGLVRHVLDEHDFKDTGFFYRFA